MGKGYSSLRVLAAAVTANRETLSLAQSNLETKRAKRELAANESKAKDGNRPLLLAGED